MARARQRKLRQRRRNAQELVIIPLVLIVAMAVLIVSTPRYSGYVTFSQPAELDRFAQCLTQKGAILFGVYNDPQTKAQKALFGNSFRFINYVECDPEHIAGQPQVCSQAGVESAPTWLVSGQKSLGFQNLVQLSQFTGCR